MIRNDSGLTLSTTCDAETLTLQCPTDRRLSADTATTFVLGRDWPRCPTCNARMTESVEVDGFECLRPHTEDPGFVIPPDDQKPLTVNDLINRLVKR